MDLHQIHLDFVDKENLEKVGKVLTCITDKKLSMKPSPATNLSMTWICWRFTFRTRTSCRKSRAASREALFAKMAYMSWCVSLCKKWVKISFSNFLLKLNHNSQSREFCGEIVCFDTLFILWEKTFTVGKLISGIQYQKTFSI